MSSHRRRSTRARKLVESFDPVVEANKPQWGTPDAIPIKRKSNTRRKSRAYKPKHYELIDLDNKDKTTDNEDDDLFEIEDSRETVESEETEASEGSEEEIRPEKEQTEESDESSTIELPSFVEEHLKDEHFNVSSLKEEHLRLRRGEQKWHPKRKDTKPKAPTTHVHLDGDTKPNYQTDCVYLDVAVCCSLLSASCFLALYNAFEKNVFGAVVGFFYIGCAGAFGTLKFLGFPFANRCVLFFSEISSKLALPLIAYSYVITRIPFWKHRLLKHDLIIVYLFKIIYLTMKLLFRRPHSAALVSFWVETAALLTIFYAEYMSISADRPYGSFGVVLFIFGSFVMKQTKWEFLMKLRKHNWFYLMISASVYLLSLGL
uniref:Uncharacterized protein n=1 Tax=Aplanochytrium stocchinoi TaxID=215587 RepID=A0A7S3V208_9STRA|mmetsp:Transcript_35108/g.43316  ORF Transcript_35108/g.43316 Transcript_35108/m.43316 type:complete len:374 (+) Transcript_35108:342-1463(+)